MITNSSVGFGADKGFNPLFTARGVKTQVLVSAIQQTFEYYAEQLTRNIGVLSRNRALWWLSNPEVIEQLALGYCAKSPGHPASDGETPEGALVRSLLREAELLRSSGFQYFAGSLVFPAYSDNGSEHPVSAYGHRIGRFYRTSDSPELYWRPGSIQLYNRVALHTYQEVILCKCPIDAAALWSAGFHNVVATMGLNQFSDQHLTAFFEEGVQRVFIAFGNKGIASRCSRLVSQALRSVGIECLRLSLPRGVDVHEFGLGEDNPSRSYSTLLSKARPCLQTYEGVLRDALNS